VIRPRSSRRALAAGLALLSGRVLVVADPRTGEEDYVDATSEAGLMHLRVAALASKTSRAEILEVLLNGGEVARRTVVWRLL
jgi:hypothetical protein